MFEFGLDPILCRLFACLMFSFVYGGCGRLGWGCGENVVSISSWRLSGSTWSSPSIYSLSRTNDTCLPSCFALFITPYSLCLLFSISSGNCSLMPMFISLSMYSFSGQVRGHGHIGSGQLLVEHRFAISLWMYEHFQVQHVYQY